MIHKIKCNLIFVLKSLEISFMMIIIMGDNIFKASFINERTKAIN